MTSASHKQPGEGGRRKRPSPLRPLGPDSLSAPGASQQGASGQPGLWPLGQGAPRVLIASASRVERESLAARLSARGMQIEQAATPADALAAVATDRFDLAMVQSTMGSGRGLELVRGMLELDGGLGVVMLARKADMDDAVGAMREGVLDYLVGRLDGAALALRVEHAVGRARRARAQQQRVERLKRVCRDINSAQEAMNDQVGSLCDDLTSVYQELNEQVAQVGLAAEFNSLVRQELDLESLLRTVLEFVLAKLGPTNAAIFLPSTTGDYTLGAYVNYDCPRDTAEVLLEHLAGVMPERFDEEASVVVMRSERALVERLGDHADWLDGHAVACFSCRHDDECLAVVTLFRDRRTGFGDEHVATLETISELFAGQLARVIHIHHRHLPKEKWGLGDDAEDGADDYGMAA